MGEDQLRVLIIEDDAGDLEFVREILDESEGQSILLKSATSLKEGFGLLLRGDIDVILLDLGLPDSQGLITVVKTYTEHPEIPIVVLTGHEDQSLGAEALKRGAQDYLSKGRIDEQVLARSIRYAVERNRLMRELEKSKERERRERETRALEEFRMNPAASVVAEMYQEEVLEKSAPQLFEELVTRYCKLLDQALEERVLKRKHGTAKEVEEIAVELGRLKSRPNDLVDLHRTALARVSVGQPAQKVLAYTEEGRILFIGLMGHLAAFYRHYYVGSYRKPQHTIHSDGAKEGGRT